MNAKNLMIGDWVLAEGKPLQVTNISILGGDIIRVMNPFMSYDTAYASNIVALSKGAKDINKIEPIPLTEEILEKNGYTPHDDLEGQSVEWISEDNSIIMSDWEYDINSNNHWYIHIDNEDMDTICTAEITYVHELQHLLKLCKIDNEIILY